ncbi:hypothetical protein [Enterococcus nangangensis]|uniref:hypothetical protein n=1 Tax=Enterococcus nangangensis TaxID=2559926 RepID=UPI0010F56665|nr:hypothetical protein [Enterococcus nangangensis]
MSNFFALVFLVSCVGTWFFIKKQTNRKKLNVGIGLILISIVCIGLLGGCTAKSNGKDAASSSSSTTISTSEVKKEKLTLKAPAEVEAGTNKKAEITGVTLPGAVVSIDSGNSVTADKKGNFKLSYEISGEESKELTINAKLADDKISSKILIKQNSEVVAQLQAEATKKAEEEAAAQKVAEEQAAAQKAAEEQAAAQKAAEEQAAAQKAAEEQASAQKASEEQAAAQKASEEQAAAQTTNNEQIVYVAPDSGKKYHFSSTCRGLSKANSVVSMTLSEAQAQGYTLCGWED